MAAGTPTTIYQSTDIFIVDVAWAADADVTDTVIAHGLLGTPQEVEQSIRVITGALNATAYPGISWIVDGTNLTARKNNNAAGSACTVRYTCRRITHPRSGFGS